MKKLLVISIFEFVLMFLLQFFWSKASFWKAISFSFVFTVIMTSIYYFVEAEFRAEQKRKNKL